MKNVRRADTIRSLCGRIVRESTGASEDRTLDAVLSTRDIALDGHRVLGWELPKTCPLVDSHRDTAGAGVACVIGRVTPRWDGQRLLGRLTFAAADINPTAELAFRLCQAGYVSDVSVSFIPVEWEYAHQSGRRPGAMDIAVARLLETSVVAVGSDQNAKILGRALMRAGTRQETREDRRIRANAILARCRAESQSREDRIARARELIGRT